MPLTRVLKDARDAFGDAARSAAVHGKADEGEEEEKEMILQMASEQHSKTGEFMRSFVLGGLDGICTTFAVVSGANGGGLGTGVILVLGVSTILADALSMGLGDALSTKAENEYILREKAREEWELKNYPQGEIREMVELMVEKGMAEDDAQMIMKRWAKYPDLFVELMMNLELEMQVPDEDGSPWLGGLVTFSSFVFFGSFPLLVYVLFANSAFTSNELFAISSVVAGIMFFVLGALKTKFTQQTWWRGGIEIFLMGSACAAVSYWVGYAVERAVLQQGLGIGDLH